MTETLKLRRLLDRLDNRPAHNPTFSRELYDREQAELLARIQGQSVLALEEQLADYRAHVRGTEIVQCKVCQGNGRRTYSGSLEPCPACSGSGLVRV